MKYDVKNMKSYLRKNDISKVELMGVMGIIIISKDVIRKNADVGEFVKYTTKIKFPEYVIKSRTLMSARINRILVNIEDESEVRRINRKVLEYLDNIENEKISDGARGDSGLPGGYLCGVCTGQHRKGRAPGDFRGF